MFYQGLSRSSGNHKVGKWSYMNSSNPNYGTNSMAFEIGAFTFYFSYDTVVAFSAPGEGLVLSENLWGPTTGRHLNEIGGYSSERLPREKFDAKLNKLMETLDRAITGTLAYQDSDLGVIVNK